MGWSAIMCRAISIGRTLERPRVGGNGPTDTDSKKRVGSIWRSMQTVATNGRRRWISSLVTAQIGPVFVDCTTGSQIGPRDLSGLVA
jgi:hypothetical protein